MTSALRFFFWSASSSSSTNVHCLKELPRELQNLTKLCTELSTALTVGNGATGDWKWRIAVDGKKMDICRCRTMVVLGGLQSRTKLSTALTVGNDATGDWNRFLPILSLSTSFSSPWTVFIHTQILHFDPFTFSFSFTPIGIGNSNLRLNLFFDSKMEETDWIGDEISTESSLFTPC
ncbi:MFS transporter [Sesbania bispinosa]|nr:MFS transporter [Sesbania bispinosa]